jgi:hypothetical protein
LRSPVPAGTGPGSSVSATNCRRRSRHEKRIGKNGSLRHL